MVGCERSEKCRQFVEISLLGVQIDSLDALDDFSVANNKLESLPESIGNLISLSQLCISYNQLSGEIPESICSLNFCYYMIRKFRNLSTIKIYNSHIFGDIKIR